MSIETLPRVKLFAKLECVFLQNKIESIIKGFIGKVR